MTTLTEAEHVKVVPMFFWDKQSPPENFVDLSKTVTQRLALAGALSMGEVLDQYKGMARCRFPSCGKVLGSCDMVFRSGDVFGKIFTFPEKCGHYVLDHGVWVPEAAEFMAAVMNSFSGHLLAGLVQP